MLMRLMVCQRNLYVLAYPNYQALCMVLAAVRMDGFVKKFLLHLSRRIRNKISTASI